MAFILFKIAESYRIDEKPVFEMNVWFTGSQGTQKRFFEQLDPKKISQSNHYFDMQDQIGERIFLIDASPPLMASEFDISPLHSGYPVNPFAHETFFSGKNISDSLIIHSGGIKNLSTDYLPNLIEKYYFQNLNTEAKSIKYALSEVDKSRIIIESPLPELKNKDILIVVKFSIENSGNVGHVFIQKARAKQSDVNGILAELRKWKFSPLNINVTTHDISKPKWGTIIFYSE